MTLTPVDKFGEVWVKREDLAGYTGPDYPSGSKVRQYAAMAAASPGVPMIVGCSANSAMQIYVSAAARLNKVDAFVFIPQRKDRTAATAYAYDMGAAVSEQRPGYLNVIRKRAREFGRGLPKVVRWDVKGAIEDAAAQCGNIPDGVQRIVVATGSGLTAAGVLLGLLRRGAATGVHQPVVIAYAVSPMAQRGAILRLALTTHYGVATKLGSQPLPDFRVLRSPYKYDQTLTRQLPDGTPLDPYYAAKAWDELLPGDCLWTPGLRPVRAMPEKCQVAFKGWKYEHIL